MNIFNSFNSERFTLNSVPFFRNYISIVVGDKLEVFNCYENRDVLVPLTHYSEFNINSVTFASAIEVQSALMDVTYVRTSMSGSVFNQNNKVKRVGLGYSATITATEVVERMNARTTIVSEIETPVLLSISSFPVIVEGSSFSASDFYIYAFKPGKGTYGIGGVAVTTSDIVLLSILKLIPQDIEDNPDATIIPLTVPDGTSFVDIANENTYDFGDSGTETDTGVIQYYFSFEEDGDLLFAFFTGLPGIYGDGATPFTEDMFVITTKEGVPVGGVMSVTGSAVDNTNPSSPIINLPYGYGTPQKWGYKEGNTIEDNTTAFINCFLNEDRVFLYGEYTTNATAAFRTSQTVESCFAVVNKMNSGSILRADHIEHWNVKGSLTLSGAGNVAGAQLGLYITGCNNFKMEMLTVRNISGYGVYFDGTAEMLGNRGNKGLWGLVSVQSCWVGVEFAQRAEYHTLQNVNIGGCGSWGLRILSGNIKVVGGTVTDNANGIYLGGPGGNNNSHGQLIGVSSNHNTGYNLYAENVEEGHTIQGCHFYGTPYNIAIVNSYGLLFNGCIIDGEITNTDSNTPKGTHLFLGCQMNSLTVKAGDMTSVYFHDCFVKNGGLWSGNSIDTTVIHTTGDEEKTGMLTLIGAGPGTLKLQRSTFGVLFANSSTDDGYLAYNIGGTTLLYRVFGNGNITIGQAAATDTGERLQVNGEAKVGAAVASTSAMQKGQAEAYADAKVVDSITNGITDIAPSQNAVFDALALKADITSLPIVITQTETIDFPDPGSHAASDALPFTVTGAAIGDEVIIVPPLSILTDGSLIHCVYSAFVSATNEVTARVQNPFTSGVTIPSADYKIIIRK